MTVQLCHELIKLDIHLFKHADNFEARATSALKGHAELRKTSNENFLPKLRVWDVISMHKTLMKWTEFANESFG